MRTNRSYWIDTQKGKAIQIMILKWADKFYKYEELIEYKHLFTHIFVWSKVASRLSELLKDWIVEVKYFENPNKYKWFLWFHRARYRLKSEFIPYYKELYNLK